MAFLYCRGNLVLVEDSDGWTNLPHKELVGHNHNKYLKDKVPYHSEKLRLMLFLHRNLRTHGSTMLLEIMFQFQARDPLLPTQDFYDYQRLVVIGIMLQYLQITQSREQRLVTSRLVLAPVEALCDRDYDIEMPS